MSSTARFRILLVLFLTLLIVGAMSTNAMGQATISTGNIAGTITDPNGAVITGAKVTIISLATGERRTYVSTSVGTFNSGPIIPGDWTVRVEAKGFKTTETKVTVNVGTSSSTSFAMPVGASSEVIEVQGAAIAVNTEQATVGGVLTSQQIETLPFNGRNFLDLAQLEPGVQIQDGSNFDPTKGGFSGISVGGRMGRSTRIELDGLDITDETVGTTVTNVSAGAIQEFQISQSTLDLSTELTSGGAVNVASRQGGNVVHGEAFYLYRDKDIAANFNGGQNAPYQRNHFGGRIGAPIIKDHWFVFANIERVKQDESAPIVNSGPALIPFNGTAPTPFREVTSLLRTDVKLNSGASLFYRLTYDHNSGTSDFGVFSHNTFTNINNAITHGWGADFSNGNFAHSFRVGYVVFHNSIGDASSRGADLVPGAQVRIGGLAIGPNVNAPQATLQRNNQVKYDGSWVRGSHTIRYGGGYNRIRGGGFAAFFANGPQMTSEDTTTNEAFADDSCDPGLVAAGGAFAGDVAIAAAAAGTLAGSVAGLQPCFPGGHNNLLNYPITGTGVRAAFRLSNGQGFFTELPAFGFPAGGQYDNRVQWYVGDSWRFRSNLTLTYGLRYVRDTGRTNSDLPPIPCSALDVTAFNPLPACPASGRLLDILEPGFGKSTRQDNNNYGGMVGLTWDPWKKGKTVLRAGAGLYYENAIFNNVLFGRPGLLQAGLFNATPIGCSQNGVGADSIPFPSGPVSVTPGGRDINTQVCGQAIGAVGGDIVALQKQYIAAVTAAGPAANAQFPGHNLAPNFAGVSFYAPNYRSPYSIQMNAGVQRELKNGMVLSADLIRNVNLHYLLGVDTNHVGDARFLNKNAATNAINRTLVACGAATIDASLVNCPNFQTPAQIAAGTLVPANIGNYAARGLDSGNAFLSGGPFNLIGANPNCPPPNIVPCSADVGAAFPGINTFSGGNTAFEPVGRSVYNALQLSFKLNRSNPMPLVEHVALQASYALSRFKTESGDQEFIVNAADQARVGRFFGPAVFDRTHQFSVGTTLDWKKGLRTAFLMHVRSPLPTTLSLNTSGSAQIFKTDLTGDGTVGDIVGNIGQYNRSISPGSFNAFVAKFNSTVAGTLTPAGQALVTAGLFTSAQLIALKATVPTIKPAPAGQIGNDWLNQFDLKLSYRVHVTEKFTVEPGVSIYNLFNYANFNTFPDQRVSGVMSGGGTAVNGNATTPGNRDQFRAIQTPSLYGLGAARQAELGLRISW